MSLVFSHTVRFTIITRRILTASVLVVTTTLALGVCDFSKPQTPAVAPTIEATTVTPTQFTTPASVPAVPGYRPGEIPSVPLFSVPTIDVFTSNTDKAVVQAASLFLISVPGAMVSPTECDGISLASSSMVLDGDGPAVSSSDRDTVVNDGIGSDVITESPVSIIYGGDGSGIYSNVDTMMTITVGADGPDTYSTTTTSTIPDGNGSDNHSNANFMKSIISNGDDSGQSSKGTVTTTNSGDSTGSYPGEKLIIQGNGNGTATISGVTVNGIPKVEKVSKLGKSPAIESLKPVESYGTVITLEDGILSDLGESDIRPEAAQTLKSLVGVLNSTKVPTTYICGYTDSILDEAFDLQLLQERAGAVPTELKKDGASAILDAAGCGESRPVALNESTDGSNNPAGRALSRRVEIFTPAF